MKRIAMGSDHAGFHLKEELRLWLEERGLDVTDLGVHDTERVDYPRVARRLAAAVAGGEADGGILVCGSGVGMCITANKVDGVRAVVCSEPYSARMSRAHNDANVLALGARVVGSDLARDIVDAWLDADFEGGRHGGRVDLISAVERGEPIDE